MNKETSKQKTKQRKNKQKNKERKKLETWKVSWSGSFDIIGTAEPLTEREGKDCHVERQLLFSPSMWPEVGPEVNTLEKIVMVKFAVVYNHQAQPLNSFPP